MQIRLLFFIDGMRNGGKERQLATLLKQLSDNKGYKITLAVMNSDIHFKEILEMDMDIRFLLRSSRFDLSVISKFNKLCSEFKPHIIHSWDSLTATYAIPAVLTRKIKFINGSIRHAARPRILSKLWWITKITYPFSHRVVSNSLAGLSARHKHPDQKYRCIVNGFLPDRITELEPVKTIRNRFNIKTPHVVGMVANFEDRKDYRSFIKAAEQVLEKKDDVTFIAIGEGKNFKSIKESIREEHRSRIILPGRERDVESVINIFDIGLLINNTSGHGEGISNSIMEYMALGKPVIATDSGGNKEIVQNEKTGFIIPPFDPVTLADKIQLLLNNKPLAFEMGANGRERISKKFSIEQLVSSYTRLYAELL